MNRLLSVAVLGFSFILGSCDEASAPKGREGVVTVRAYVDRDASGTLTEGDSLIDGLQASLVREGEEVATVTTEDGVGVSEPLEPGNYQVTVIDGAPTGAALLTNPQPTVTVNARGDSTRVDFRYTFFPGTITGRLWIDDGTTAGEFDAADTPGPGIRVFLRVNNGGTPGDTVATTQTDANGIYTFTLVAPGSYFVEFEVTGDFDYGTAGPLRAITVTGQETTAQNAIFTGSLLMTIEAARARQSGTVLVRGNVIVRPGSFTSGTDGVNSEVWIQDATGGIAVFAIPTADSATYAIGDLLEVRGTRTSFAGQEQIANPGLTFTELTGATVRQPVTVTGAQFNSRANEGELITIDSVQVTGVGGGTGASFTVLGTARDGQTVAIRVHGPTTAQQNTGLTRADFVVGNYYRITGVLTENVFNDVSTPQVKPRMRSDVVDLTVVAPPTVGVRFSEIHYDNAVVADEGEAIEISGPVGTDLTGWQIVLYNGSATSLSTYDTKTLSGAIPATCGTRGVVVQTYPSNGIQNGDPDGFALVNAAGQVVEFLSYEGTFTAANGPAAGMTSTDIGVREDGATTLVGQSLQRLPDGSWTGPLVNTFGVCNDSPAPPPPPQAPVRFSEIHYDNTGTDAGEAIEVAGPAGTDLTGWQIALYNGNGGAPYGTPVTLSGTLPATCGGRGVMVATYPVNGLQNGGGATPEPDGFALVNAAGTVVEFLSYEGTITAVGGPANGMTSTNIGVAEAGTEPAGLSLQRIADGTWIGPIANTFGACNDN